MSFHAPMADADSDGNNFQRTYAKRRDLNLLKSENANTEAELRRMCGVAEKKADDTMEEQMKAADALSGTLADVDKLKMQMSAVIGEDNRRVCKGLFESEALLRLVSPRPIIGDFAFVRAMKAEELNDETARVAYWGDRYIGIKTDKSDVWEDVFDEVGDKVMYDSVGSKYYYVLGKTTYDTLAHETVEALVANQHIKELKLNDEDDTAYFLYNCTEMEVWNNTEEGACMSVPQVMESAYVTENGVSQKSINLQNELNAVVINNNNAVLRRIVNMLVNVVNEMQSKAAYVDEHAFTVIPSAAISDIGSGKFEANRMLDFGLLDDFILS